MTAEGSVAAVTFDGTRFFCCICENSYCVHCAYLKIKKNRGDDVPEYLDNLFKKTKMHKSPKTRESTSWKRIPFNMDDPETMKPPSHYLLKAGENYVCEDKDTSCHFCNKETLWEISSIKLLTLFCKGYSINCKGM